MTAGAENAAEKIEDGAGRAGAGGVRDAGVADDGGARLGRVAGNSVVPLRAGGAIAGIVPTSIEEVFRLATAIAKSGMAPRDMSTAEKLTVAILHGLEIGIPPMMAINKIAVVNGRPTLWGDAVPALLLSKGFKLRETHYDAGDARFASCTVIRPNGENITRTFSVEDAKLAGLWGKQGPWKQYPDRMLQMRARGLAARDGAADVLSGIYLAEEMQDVTPEPDPSSDLLAPPPKSTRRKTAYRAKIDGDDVAYNELRGAVSSADTLDDLDTLTASNADFLLILPYPWAQIVEAEISDKRAELASQTAE